MGAIHYDRSIHFSAAVVARTIKSSKGFIMVHGIAYNNNGKYDFEGAGKRTSTRACQQKPTQPYAERFAADLLRHYSRPESALGALCHSRRPRYGPGVYTVHEDSHNDGRERFG
jgi:hypothetical protein